MGYLLLAAAFATATVAIPPMPDPTFCGAELPPPNAREPPWSCKLPGLPCGPVAASRVGPSGAEAQEDLDGDGQPDITLAGRSDLPKPAAYSVIYLASPSGDSYLLSDYQDVDPRADPAVATVLLRLPGGTPLIRDGYDFPPTDGNTLSMARLRRWDGKRFRTLLTYCRHRAQQVPIPRDAQNRTEFIDVDQDGTKEVVLTGYLRPVVYKLAEDGLSLHEDLALTRRCREQSPEEQRGQKLGAEATRLCTQGEWRRAASLLIQAHNIVPYNVEVSMQLARVWVRLGEADKAIPLLQQVAALAPERAQTACALAQAYKATGDEDEERKALKDCLDKAPDPADRKSAEDRLKELQSE